MENKLINCDASSSNIQHIAHCASSVFLSKSRGFSYIPGGPGDGGARFSSEGSIFGQPLAYPFEWKPRADFYESRSMKVTTCLVIQGSLSLLEMSNLMSCSSTPIDSKSSQEETKEGNIAEVFAWLFGGLLFVCALCIVLYVLKRQRNQGRAKKSKQE